MSDMNALLQKTSRTFAVAIPMLSEPVREQVTLAYLLFRIADTFEDASHWPRESRLGALDNFNTLVADIANVGWNDTHAERAESFATAWCAAQPCSHEGYLELLQKTPAVLSRFGVLSADVRRVIAHHTLRTSNGMAGFVRDGSADGSLSLHSVPALKHYCYIVAGIVGELLTDLFLLDSPVLSDVANILRSNAIAFGEGLQLVNILKDVADDARDGRVYLPTSTPREEIFALARHDLECAADYVQALQRGGAPRGAVAFCAFPVLLARETLREVEQRGPGAKVPRERVFQMIQRLDTALDTGSPALD